MAAELNDLFMSVANPLTNTVDLKGVMRLMWPILDNSVGMIDVANTFSICNQQSSSGSSGKDTIGLQLFTEFIGSMARLKFPASADYLPKTIEALHKAKSRKVMETPFVAKAFERNVCRVFLKFDLPLRRAFCNFAGTGSNIGAGVTWDEVKALNVGMEVDGWTSFCSACSVTPEPVSLEQCKAMAKESLSEFPLAAAADSQHSTLMFPAFQVALCKLAIELQHYEAQHAEEERAKTMSDTKNPKRFAKKVIVQDIVPLANLLQSLLRNMGIDKMGPSGPTMSLYEGAGSSTGEFNTALGFEGSAMHDAGLSGGATGEIDLPQLSRPEDQYTQYLNQGRLTIQLRLDHLFDEVETRLITTADPEGGMLQTLRVAKEEQRLTAMGDGLQTHKYASKPVVIGDALPIPATCPEAVEQLLEAALAHHNLGSYDESLKFLEAARLQLEELEVKRLRDELMGAGMTEEGSEVKATAEDSTASATEGADVSSANPVPALPADFEVVLPLDIEMYITLCKGNVYQSSGDDENSLQQYVNAWARADKAGDKEWQMVCINSIGMLAYYSLRYDVSIMCFYEVVRYRSEKYGPTSVDTCTAINNEGCALYAIGNKSGARLRFERSWNEMCKALGHRHPRCIATWKNLERSKRTSSLRKSDLEESVGLRPDADRLLYGDSFQINAVPPPEAAKKGGKGGKKGKKGGKKKKK